MCEPERVPKFVCDDADKGCFVVELINIYSRSTLVRNIDALLKLLTGEPVVVNSINIRVNVIDEQIVFVYERVYLRGEVVNLQTFLFERVALLLKGTLFGLKCAILLSGCSALRVPIGNFGSVCRLRIVLLR